MRAKAMARRVLPWHGVGTDVLSTIKGAVVQGGGPTQDSNSSSQEELERYWTVDLDCTSPEVI